MRRERWILGAALVLVACSAPEVTERFRSERELYAVESRFRSMRKQEGLGNRNRLRELAVEFEAVAAGVPPQPTTALRMIEAQAWVRAAECHQAIGDSGRAELILTTSATSYADLPQVLGEVSLQLGRVAEHHGHYREALAHYRTVVRSIAPDPGPDLDPDAIVDPDAEPEEDRADDFVLALPLSMARLATMDSTIADPDLFYEEARAYYTGMLGDNSPFVRTGAAVFLAETEAEHGRWLDASRRLDQTAAELPPAVRTEYQPAQLRLTSLEYQIQAWEWGKTTRDSVTRLLDDYLEEFGRTESAPVALFAMARTTAAVGFNEDAIALVQRLHRSYPTAPVLAEAELFQARLLANTGRWPEAELKLRALPHDYPTSMAALGAPLEIVYWYQRNGDPSQFAAALRKAERAYREMIERYPSGPHSIVVRRRLIHTLDLASRPDDALEALIAMCDQIALPAQRPGLLLEAARRAEEQLADPGRAATILDRIAQDFPNTRIGRRAVQDAHRLRLQAESS